MTLFDSDEYPQVCPYCKMFKARNEKEAEDHLDGGNDEFSSGCSDYWDYLAFQEKLTDGK